MSWIVLGEDKGYIKLVSKQSEKGKRRGILPKGSFLTVEPDDFDSKFILRVDDSSQHDPYSPSPLVVDMDLSGLMADRKSQNIVHAYRVRDISSRDDGLIDFIPPQSLARRSNQKEIDFALDNKKDGPPIFPATIHGGQNQLLVDDELNLITANLPEEMFFYQTQICGKTGSGKTVAAKYLAQYFVEEMNGAVLAINVKDTDFLVMDKPTNEKTEQIEKEWNAINKSPKPTDNFTVYYPATQNIRDIKGINHDICEAITLNVNTIEPEALTGLLQNISDIGAQSFPDIFRYWQELERGMNDTFNSFVKYFVNHEDNPRFKTLNSRGDESEVSLHPGTFKNIQRNIHSASIFFDDPNAKTLSWQDILYKNKLSVINVNTQKDTVFGSILLRHLLKQIVEAKDKNKSKVPILVIIDEVHQFYNTDASKDALGDLDTICRTGRSKKIGVIFSSQNQDDLPKGLSSVINTKFFFKTDSSISRNKFNVSPQEISTLKKGFAVANIHSLPELNIVKFPLALSGVIEDE